LSTTFWIASERSPLSDRPIRIAELLPKVPSVISASDASGVGLGGFHFLPLPGRTIQPLFWHQPIPSSITECLIADNNPSDTITMNDFELAVSVVHHDVLAQYADIPVLATYNFHDNTTAVNW
jgi:hypothetical protein